VDAGRATIVAAFVAAVASFGTAGATIAADVYERSPHHAAPNCGALLERDLQLAKAFPQVARLYASGKLQLPALETREEMDACGDPALLFKAMNPKLPKR
jgi:hypothetical protein